MTHVAPRTKKLTTRIRRLSWAVIGPIAAMMLTATLAFAQFRASIQGTVTDPQGAVIPGAYLTLNDLSTNITWTAKSDGNGNYTFNALPADTFSLTITAPNFAGKTLNNVTIIPEQPNTLNVKLDVGSKTELVTVNAGAVPALDTTTASISGTITSNQIEHMPALGGDVFQLATLAPGMFGDNAQSSSGNENNLPDSQGSTISSSNGIFGKGEFGPQVIGNGGRLDSPNIQIDGIPTASASWGGSTVILPTEDSVQYMKVTANDYDAEFGRFSGAVIQVTSKTGTNSYHGSAFFVADRPGLNAWQRWNGPNSVGPADAGLSPAGRGLAKDQQRFNQFGGSAGGPILHNKLFAFFAYETFRNNSVTTSTGLFDTPAFDAMAPANSIASKYLTLKTEAPIPLNIIPGTCSSDIGVSDTSGYCEETSAGTFIVGSPLTTPLGTHDTSWVSNAKPGVGSGLPAAGSQYYVGDLEEIATSNPSTFTGTQYNGRMDGQITAKDRASFIIYWAPDHSLAYNGPSRPANERTADDTNDAFTALWNHTFSPTLLNEARANAGGYRYNLIAENPQVPFGLPQDSFTGQTNGQSEPNYFGPSTLGVFDQWTYTYQDILTKTAGRHSVKSGFQLSHIEFLEENVSDARPSFTFQNIWDFLNDAPVTESGTFDPITGAPALIRYDMRQNVAGIFVQDDFRVRPTLTVNAGLRWNYFGPLTEKQNSMAVAVPGSGSAMLTGLKMVLGGPLYTVQMGNFGPQLGFAWQPGSNNSRLVFRGGFGINYEENQIAATSNGNGNIPNTLAFGPTPNYSSSILYATPPTSVYNPFGFPSNPNAITTFNSNNIPTATAVSIYAFDGHVKTTTVYHFSLDTEMQLPANFVATLGYQGSTGHHLLYEQDLNAVAVAKGYPLNSQLNRVLDFTNGANSNYNAMLASLRHNFSHSFQMETDYTWSKSMDEGSSPSTEDAYAPISIHDVYGRSDYNFGNNLRVFGLYQPTFFHDHWPHTFADGWSLGGTYEYHSGFPWTPTYPVTATGTVGAQGANLYYENSPYSTIRPAAFSGGRLNTSTAAFESGPSASSPSEHNVNFPAGTGGENYFTPPKYTAVGNNTAFSATNIAPPPGPAMERNSFNGPMFQSANVSLIKGFNLPPARIIGEHASWEFRADAYNLFNLNSLTAPSTSVTSTTFGQSSGALGSRTVELQTRFSF